MSKLHQINLQYEPREDRILLRTNTRDGAEFRFWMTRRFVTVLWPVLVRLVESHEHVQRQPRPESRNAVVELQRESALRSADFKTRYQPAPQGAPVSLPLGEEPVVLATVRVKRHPDGRPVLCLHPAKGQGIELALHHGLLHSFCKLVSDTSQHAGWSLDLELTRGGAVSGPVASSVN